MIIQNKGLLALIFKPHFLKKNQVKLHTCLELKPPPHTTNLVMISVILNTNTTSCQYSKKSFENKHIHDK